MLDMPVLRDLDAMEELRKVQCPTIIIRGLRSTRYPPEILEPLQKEFPDIAWGPLIPSMISPSAPPMNWSLWCGGLSALIDFLRLP